MAALPSVACAVLPSAIQAFRSRYPGVEVRVHDVLHERAVDMVLDGVADLAVSIRPAHRAELKFHELGSDGMHLVCGADHALARRKQAVGVISHPFPSSRLPDIVRSPPDRRRLHLLRPQSGTGVHGRTDSVRGRTGRSRSWHYGSASAYPQYVQGTGN